MCFNVSVKPECYVHQPLLTFTFVYCSRLTTNIPSEDVRPCQLQISIKNISETRARNRP